MTFYCKLLLRIHGCFGSASSLDLIVFRYVELPFAPYKGLYLRFSGDVEILIDDRVDKRVTPSSKQLYESVEKCQISWLVDLEQFEIWLPSDKEIYWSELDHIPHRDVKEIAQEYIDIGFALCEGSL